MRPGEQVRRLRTNGWDVRVRVERPLAKGARWTRRPVMLAKHELCGARWATKGGRTFVQVTDPSGRRGSGHANCNPEDVFAYEPGLRLALHRALGELDQVLFRDIVSSYMREHDIAGPAVRAARQRAREVVAAVKRQRLSDPPVGPFLPASSSEPATP